MIESLIFIVQNTRNRRETLKFIKKIDSQRRVDEKKNEKKNETKKKAKIDEK